MKLGTELIHSINQRSKWPLSENERRILSAVLVSGILEFWFMRQNLFPNTDKSNLHRSLKRLEERELIEPVTNDKMVSSAWRLNSNILSEFTQKIPLQGHAPYRLILSMERHNRLVRATARTIDRTLKVDWIAHEPTLRANEMTKIGANKFSLAISVPDLLTAISEGDEIQKIAWEVELTPKSKSRINQILENRMTSKNWQKVVYLLGSGVSVERMLERNSHVTKTSVTVIRSKRANPILFVRGEEFEAVGPNAKGRSLNGEVSLGDFIQN